MNPSDNNIKEELKKIKKEEIENKYFNTRMI